jgi:hypothetical protein
LQAPPCAVIAPMKNWSSSSVATSPQSVIGGRVAAWAAGATARTAIAAVRSLRELIMARPYPSAMDELAAYERRLRRAGLPLLIEDYSAYEDIFTRAVPLLSLVVTGQRSAPNRRSRRASASTSAS